MQPLGQNELPSLSICYFLFGYCIYVELELYTSFDFLTSIFTHALELPNARNVLIVMMFSPSQLSYCCNCFLSLHTYMTTRGTKMYVGRRTNQIIGQKFPDFARRH